MQFKQAGDFIMDKLFRDLPAWLTYHNAQHTLDVYQAAEQIGQAEQISNYEMTLLLTAAWYHDAGFLELSVGHEDVSCRIVQDTLPSFNYRPEEIKHICGLIMATKLPQTPQNHLEEILADADLDYLGRDDFFIIGNQLYLEFLTSGVVKNEEEWNRLQVRFLESHHYFTKTAINLRQAKKEAHLLQVKAKLKQ